MIREPLVHFLLIGAGLFLLFQWTGSAGAGGEIVITRGQIEHLTQSFESVWLRPPTAEELKGLVDDSLREEVAVREAVKMGLDRDDTVIRRRLRQKLEFLFEDALTVHPPTDEDLALWLERHAGSYRSDSSISFRQVPLRFDRKGESADAAARRLLADLERVGESASIAQLGDSLSLPQEVPLSPRREVASLFGEEFASRILEVEPGRWRGPLESGYGLHLVFVRERASGRLPALAEVRDAVERDLLAARRRAELEATYERLLSQYRVVVEEAQPRTP